MTALMQTEKIQSLRLKIHILVRVILTISSSFLLMTLSFKISYIEILPTISIMKVTIRVNVMFILHIFLGNFVIIFCWEEW